MRRVISLVVAALLAAVAVWAGLAWLEASQGPEDTPAPSADLVLPAQDARAGAAETGLDERVSGGGDQGPHVRTEPVSTSAPEGPHLRMPSVGVDSPVTTQGIEGGYMTIPRQLDRTGWLSTTASMEQATEGSTLLAGHVTYNRNHGALYYLGLSEPGQVVSTWDEDGVETRWVVTEVRLYNKQVLPREIFQPVGVERQLNIVTCGGQLYRGSNGYWYYDSNVVVTAVPLDPVAAEEPTQEEEGQDG